MKLSAAHHNQKGAILPLLILGLLIVGLVVATQSASIQQIFQSQAGNPQEITFTGSNVSTDAAGNQSATSQNVQIQMTSPYGVGGGNLNFGQFTRLQDLPAKVSSHEVVNYGDYIYVIGGVDSSAVYMGKANGNGGVDTWRTLTPYPYMITPKGVVAHKGYLLVLGGSSWKTSPPVPIDTVYAAKINDDGTIGNWVQQPSLPDKLNGPAFAIVKDYLFTLDGSGTKVPFLRSHNYLTSLNTDGTLTSSSREITPFPQPRVNMTAAVHGDTIYVVGGAGKDNGGRETDTIYYGRVSDNGDVPSWSTSTFPHKVALNTTLMARDYLITLGGIHSQNNQPVDVGNPKAYFAKINSDKSLGSWSNVALPLRASGKSAVVVNNYLYLVGAVVDGQEIVYSSPLNFGSGETYYRYAASAGEINADPSANSIKWQPYTTAPTIQGVTLPAGTGNKTMCVQFKSGNGQLSQVYCAAIELKSTGDGGGGGTDSKVPFNLNAECLSGTDGRRVKLTWSSPEGMTSYKLRVNNTSRGEWKGCGADKKPFDVCQEALTSTIYEMGVNPGDNYDFWVHASNGTRDTDASLHKQFSCSSSGGGTTSGNPTFSTSTISVNAQNQIEIRGSNFGATQGTVYYSRGGNHEVPVTVINWSDTLVRVSKAINDPLSPVANSISDGQYIRVCQRDSSKCSPYIVLPALNAGGRGA